jgi:hypothetical protein
MVSADGEGLVSRAGVALLRQLTEETGLAGGWPAALLDTYKTFPAVHAPGWVLADLAVVIADAATRWRIWRPCSRSPWARSAYGVRGPPTASTSSATAVARFSQFSAAASTVFCV